MRKYQTPLIDKKSVPRMPWHDIGVRVIGDIVADLSRHFIQYWNFVRFDLEPTVKKNYLFTKNRNSSKKLKDDENITEKNKMMKYWEEMKHKWVKFKAEHGFSKTSETNINNKESEEKDKDEEKESLEKEKVSINIDKKNYSPKSFHTPTNNPQKENNSGIKIFRSDFIIKPQAIKPQFYDFVVNKKEGVGKKKN